MMKGLQSFKFSVLFCRFFLDKDVKRAILYLKVSLFYIMKGSGSLGKIGIQEL